MKTTIKIYILTSFIQQNYIFYSIGLQLYLVFEFRNAQKREFLCLLFQLFLRNIAAIQLIKYVAESLPFTAMC